MDADAPAEVTVTSVITEERRTIMSEQNKPATVPSVDDVVLWSVVLGDGDWYWVFARSAKQAMRIVNGTHYEDLTTREFRSQYTPKIERIPDDRKLLVDDHDTGEQRNWTAKRWCEGESPGPFVSNTYEY